MYKTCRLTAGKEFRACRLMNDSVVITGMGETINTCEELTLAPVIPVDPKSPGNGHFNLLACQEPGHVCGQIVMFKPVHGQFKLPASEKFVYVRTSSGTLEVQIEPCKVGIFEVKKDESLGIGNSYESATLDAVHHLNVPKPKNPDEGITVVVLEFGYVYGGFIANHFYVRIKAK